MKRYIEPFSCANEILAALKRGVLLTTKANDKVNTMTISWGTLGIQWGKPIFTVFVRGSRHTKGMLDQNLEFTINIPVNDIDRNILKVCGTASGRDMDKIQTLGLTLEEPDVISVPGIRELPLTLECRVLYRQQQTPDCMLDPEPHTHYPAHSENIHDDYHTAYYAEIVRAYYIENGR